MSKGGGEADSNGQVDRLAEDAAKKRVLEILVVEFR
jgi:hypothetical protein